MDKPKALWKERKHAYENILTIPKPVYRRHCSCQAAFATRRALQQRHKPCRRRAEPWWCCRMSSVPPY